MLHANSTLDTRPGSGLRRLLQTKIWERENLPLNNSLIPLELLLFLAICQAEGKRLTVKGLTSSSAFSTLGAGIHMRRLQREGYISLEQDLADRRVKYIQTTAKLDALLAAYMEVLEVNLGQGQATLQANPVSLDDPS
jgi:DNA-binding MarR family transcriptional regulator